MKALVKTAAGVGNLEEIIIGYQENSRPFILL
mgnify:CR=1 FL=1